VGLPAGLHSSLFSISNVLIQSSVNSFGEVFMSGNAAAGNIEGFVAVLDNGFFQSTVNFVGQNVGARQFDRAKKATFVCLICNAVSTFAASMLAIGFGPQLLSIYINDSQQAIESGMMRLSVVCATWFIASLMDTTTSALRGMGASAVPMVISVLGVCGLRIGWIYTIFQLPQFHTPQYLFMSYPITWSITFVAQLIAFFIVLRKLKRQFAEPVNLKQ
jgi:Na+-driven multidrug efflux pump